MLRENSRGGVTVNARTIGWRERLATIGVFFGSGLGMGAWAAVIPFLAKFHSLSHGILSVVLLAYAIGAVVAMPLAATLARRIGTGTTIRVATTCFAGALLLPLLAEQLVELILAAFAVGLTTGVLDVGMNAHATEIERRWGAPIMSSFHAAFSAGGLAGSGLSILLGFADLGPVWIIRISSLLILAFAIAARASLGHVATRPARYVFEWPRRAVLLLSAVAILCMMCEGAITDWSGVYLATVMHTDATRAAAGYAAFSAAMLTARLAGDSFVRFIGRVRAVRWGAWVAAAGLVLAAVALWPFQTIAGFALVGIGLSNVIPVTFSAAARVNNSPAAGIASVASAGYAGMMAGPPLIGGMASLIGLRASLLLLAVFAMLIAALARSMRHDKAANVEAA